MVEKGTHVIRRKSDRLYFSYGSPIPSFFVWQSDPIRAVRMRESSAVANAKDNKDWEAKLATTQP